MIDLGSRKARVTAAVVFALVMLPTLWFGARSYGSFLLLRSAYELGLPSVSNVRAWMTLRYAATTFDIPPQALVERLDLPSAISLETSFWTLADREGVERFDYMQRVQKIVVDLKRPSASPPVRTDSPSWFGFNTDSILSALLVYGYPALAITLFLGALGLPVPTGLATTLAGSLAARGQLDWFAGAAIAVVASSIGDLIGYGAGRWLGQGFIDRRGKWFGLSTSRMSYVQRLFDRWGGVTVLLTRTLVSHLSSVMSLLAGVTGYRLAGFIAFAVAGRIIWTLAYMGLGYGAGSDIEAASTFLANLSGFILGLAVLGASATVAAGYARRGSWAPHESK